MTRADVLAHFAVSPGGRISSPGKFEGERLYVPAFWECYLDGFADVDDDDRLVFNVVAHDREQFPELGGAQRVVLIARDDGFVVEVDE